MKKYTPIILFFQIVSVIMRAMGIAVVVSDIHGDEKALESVFCKALEIGASTIFCAGDLGLWNPALISILQCRPLPFICVRGNCDSPWDYDAAQLPIAPLYRSQKFGSHEIFITHGDRFSLPEDAGLSSEKGMVIITGHTHVPSLSEADGRFYLNPGSVSRPRGRYRASYATLDDEAVSVLELETGKRIFYRKF